MIFSHSELPWQQNVSRLSIQYQIEQDEKKERENLDRIVQETKIREADEQKETEHRATEAKKSWSEMLRSYWTNMEYNHSITPTSTSDDCIYTGSDLNDFNNAGSTSYEFSKPETLVPTPSAGYLVPIVNLQAGQTTHGEGSEFKRRRVSQRGRRMSTNYIWLVLHYLNICIAFYVIFNETFRNEPTTKADEAKRKQSNWLRNSLGKSESSATCHRGHLDASQS